MSSSTLYWLLLNIFSIICLGFFSMVEMACVSFNKIRLHYYVQKGMKRAIWLNYLLQHPFRLFGTTLIMVNGAMMAGSEFSRDFHASLGINPDLSPLTQVLIVVIFGELAPMFAARQYSENVAMLGAPIVYFTAKLLTPVLWLIGLMTNWANRLVVGHFAKRDFFLSTEELQNILEEHGEDRPRGPENDEFNVVTANIFRLKYMTAMDICTPISELAKVPANTTVEQLRIFLSKHYVSYVPVFHQKNSNIVGIVFPRDLIRVVDSKRIRDYARPPWFVTQATRLTDILHQFRRNNQTVAVILDEKGETIGLIDLDEVLEVIFGEARKTATQEEAPLLVIERTFPGNMKVKDFNEQFSVRLDSQGDLTLGELMAKHLGHQPEEGDSIFLDPFELTVKETKLMEVKSIEVKTILK